MCSALRCCLSVYFDLSPLGILASFGVLRDIVTLVAKRAGAGVVPIREARAAHAALLSTSIRFSRRARPAKRMIRTLHAKQP
jgi:hypothetical protein